MFSVAVETIISTTATNIAAATNANTTWDDQIFSVES